MMHFSPTLLSAFLALATGGAILTYGLQWQPEIPQVEVNSEPQAPASTSARLPDLQEGARLDVLRQRPPFTPGRRPFAPATAEVAAVVETETVATQLQVPEIKGTATSGGRSVAVILDPENNRLRRFSVGDEVGGWTIQEILSDRVRLTTDQAEAVAYSRRPGEEPRSEIKPRTARTQAADAGLRQATD